jgi:hypothetical protein
MREEISEPQQWRSRSEATPSWPSRRRARRKPLPAELVDAAFSDENSSVVSRLDAPEGAVAVEIPAPGRVDAAALPELLAGLNAQLAQLEAHRRQIEKMLAEPGDCQR